MPVPSVSPEQVSQPVAETQLPVFVGGSAVVVAGRGLGTALDFVGVTNAVTIAVVVHDDSVYAGVTHAIDVCTLCVVGVCGGICVVVAGRGIGTTCDLVGIADAVVIAVVVYDSASAVCFSGAGFATCGRDTASVFVGGSAVVVAGRGFGTALDFVGITDAVTIAVVVHDDSVYAGVTHAIDVCTLRVVGVCGGICVVVAGRWIGTTGDLVGITDAVVIAVVVYDVPVPSVSPEQVSQTCGRDTAFVVSSVAVLS